MKRLLLVIALVLSLIAPARADLNVVQTMACIGIASGATCSFTTAPKNGDIVLATLGTQNFPSNYCVTGPQSIKDSNAVTLTALICTQSNSSLGNASQTSFSFYVVTGSPTVAYTPFNYAASGALTLMEISGAATPTSANVSVSTTACAAPCSVTATSNIAAPRNSLLFQNSDNVGSVTMTNTAGPTSGAQTVLSSGGVAIGYYRTLTYFAGGGGNLCTSSTATGTNSIITTCMIILPSPFGTNGASGLMGDIIFEQLLKGWLS